MSSHPRCADCAFFRRIKGARNIDPGHCCLEPKKVLVVKHQGAVVDYKLPLQEPDDFCRHFVRAGHPWWPA